MSKINIVDFERNLLTLFKNIKLNKVKNIFITTNLNQIANLRIPKENKLKSIYKCLKKVLGPGHSIFVPTATLNLCNNDIPFDLYKTKSDKMGPFSEYIRLNNSIRCIHPFWSISGIGKKAKILNSVSKHAFGYGSAWSKMLDNNFTQVNLGIHPSKAVTLVHHVETVIGVPYRYNKKFVKIVKIRNRSYQDEFYQSVFFKNIDIKKKIALNEHFFESINNKKKLNYSKSPDGLDAWSFKMEDFFATASEMFLKDIYTYLDFKPNLSKISDL